MLTTFGHLKEHLKFKNKLISIDNIAFKFHYRITFLLLLVFCVLVTSRQYIGEHIRCLSSSSQSIPEHVLNTFCFFTTTYTVYRHYNATLLREGYIPHPGIGPMSPSEPIKRHAYYQWVPFVLFFQALCFYFPHALWRSWEGGKISKLVEGLQRNYLSRYMMKDTDMKISEKSTIYAKSTINKKVSRIKSAFIRQVEISGLWATRYIFCEVLNLLNVMLQFYWTDKFLGGSFLTLGFDFIKDDFGDSMDILDVVFPKVTKCDFYKYGASGTIQNHDVLCVMALNVINEKIYSVLWFWFVILFFVSVFALLWRGFTIVMHSRSTRFNGYIFGLACPGRMNPWDMLIVTEEFHFSDWLFLYYIAKNMEPNDFRELLIDIASDIQSAKNSVAPSEIDNDSDTENIRDYDESENLDNHSLNSDDMNKAINLNEKRVKFA